mmetsp:Transcript_25960/g.61719  ORF Transcript_25960/g.61719 Transcript_25960/m.61719 type:complete len:423 (+) Transcript_25960:195-1463(+)
MAKHDLTSRMGPYLDRHLVFPLLEFLQEKQMYPDEEVLQGKIALLQKTNMVDFAMDIHKSLYNTEEVPQVLKDRRQEVVARLKSLQVSTKSVVEFLSNPNLVKQLRSDKSFNLQFLQDEHSIGTEQIEALYHLAKFQFDCGNYSTASELLYHYRTLCTNPSRNISALWGKLAAEILLQNWDQATEDFNRLKEHIDMSSFESPVVQLVQRTWLMHWSLFIFFNQENGRSALCDLFFQELYLNALQTDAQHLLRYLAVAVVVNKRRRNVLKDLIKVIQQEEYEYSDPVTEFLSNLFVKYDFEGAQQSLLECETLLESDFFLAACKDDFVENARLFIFQEFCRIHQTIDLKMLAEKLNMDIESAELWTANLIRNARLNAKIDSQAGTVIMKQSYSSAYEQVIEKTKNLSTRSFMLASTLMGTAKV